MNETWKPVPEWEGFYEVSDAGRVRRVGGSPRCHADRILRGQHDRHGYPCVTLSDSAAGRSRNIKVHRLVSIAFLGPTPPGMEVRHLNGNPDDPRLVNLAFGTHAENMQDMVLHGRSTRDRVTKCPSGHDYSSENTFIDGRGARNCLTCSRKHSRVNARKYYRQKKERGELHFQNVRAWARSNGLSVKDTGRIAQVVLDAYDRAHREVAA